MGLSHSSTSDLNSSAEAQYIRDLISNHNVLIFSKTTCPYCRTAKQVFEDLRVPYTVIELDVRKDGNKMLSILGAMTGAKTVPRVFVNGTFIGGGDETRNLYKTGKLQQLIMAGAPSGDTR